MSTKPYHHGDLRRELVAATRAVVESDGPFAVSLADVARSCGVSVAAPYRHFASKEALLAAVAADGFTELGDAIAASQAAPCRPPHERLVDAGVAYVSFAQAHPHLFTLMFSFDHREGVGPAGPAALAGLERIVAGVDLGVPVDVAVRATWAMAHGLASLRVGRLPTFTEDDSPARLRTELTALLDGILPAGGSASGDRAAPGT